MKTPDNVFRELGQLYDFYIKISEFEFLPENTKANENRSDEEGNHSNSIHSFEKVS